MARHPIKEKTAMSVSVLASIAFVWAAVAIYGVPGETVLKYLLSLLVMLAGVMVLAALIVVLKRLLIKILNRRKTP